MSRLEKLSNSSDPPAPINHPVDHIEEVEKMHDILDPMCRCTSSLSRVLCRRGGILLHAVPPGAPLIAIEGATVGARERWDDPTHCLQVAFRRRPDLLLEIGIPYLRRRRVEWVECDLASENG